MRKLSEATTVIIVGIALYFALAWGADGLRVLTSPSYGLDDLWRAQYVFVIGRIFDLTPVGLIKLAAFFGAVKVAVAAVCVAHILDRLRAIAFGRADAEILEGGLILVVLISIVSVGPAVWSQNAELVRKATMELTLAAIACALCLIERGRAPQADKTAITTEVAATPRAVPWYSPFR